MALAFDRAGAIATARRTGFSTIQGDMHQLAVDERALKIAKRKKPAKK